MVPLLLIFPVDKVVRLLALRVLLPGLLRVPVIVKEVRLLRSKLLTPLVRPPVRLNAVKVGIVKLLLFVKPAEALKFIVKVPVPVAVMVPLLVRL